MSESDRPGNAGLRSDCPTLMAKSSEPPQGSMSRMPPASTYLRTAWVLTGVKDCNAVPVRCAIGEELGRSAERSTGDGAIAALVSHLQARANRSQAAGSGSQLPA